MPQLYRPRAQEQPLRVPVTFSLNQSTNAKLSDVAYSKEFNKSAFVERAILAAYVKESKAYTTIKPSGVKYFSR
jgi:hypothetical protein